MEHLNILVTRPHGLERTLMGMLEDAGAKAIHIPAIEITAPGDDSSRAHARDHFDEFDIAIFISPTAVKKTLEYMDVDSDRCQIAAIGSRSQKALEQAGVHVTIEPQGHDSESLLQQQALQEDKVADRNILIFRGEDGRDILADTLKQRGARVHYAAMYTRIRPDVSVSSETLASLDAITVSSNEGLQNLYDMVDDSGGLDILLQLKLFVPGERARKLAEQLGFSHIIQAENATDQAMYRALEQSFNTRV